MPYTVIDKGSKYFNTITYTASGNGQVVTGNPYKPDFVWLKRRSLTGAHYLYDVVRGANNSLQSNSTSSEASSDNYLTSFNSDGWTLGSGNYTSPDTIVGWSWLASNTTASNTSGTISSTVSANTTSGFSVGKTTGTLTSGTITVGHGLGVAPSMILWKRTDGVSNWQVYHKSTGTNLLQLNSTGAVVSGSYWGTMSSTTFTVSNSLYGAGETYAFYCFAEVKGFSKFGSYTGNGSTDGIFIYTGFKPAFLIVKRYSNAGYDWLLYDNKRQVQYNVVDDFVFPSTADAEVTGNANQSLDFLSNGVKYRGLGDTSNGSGASYIYMAFAENPFVSSKGIPCTAR